MRTWVVCLGLCVVLSSNVVADRPSIHRMVVGDRALELQDTIKLTSSKDGEVDGAWISPDGKYVVYNATSKDAKSPPAKVCIVESSGGRSTILLAAPVGFTTMDESTPMDFWLPDVDERKPIVWSPDGKSIAFVVEHLVNDPAKGVQTQDTYVMVMTTAGQRRALIALPEGCSPASTMIWSPDSRKLACAVGSMRADSDGPRVLFGDLLALNVQSGSAEIIFTQPRAVIYVDRWNPDGKSIRHFAGRYEAYQQMESFLDRKTNTVGPDLVSIPKKSPDGRMQVANTPGLSVEDMVTGDVKEVFKDYRAEVVCWTPDSKMLVYQETQMVKDAPGDRKRELNTVWIAVPEKQKMNHMCVALDGFIGSNDVFSRDGLHMVYTSGGQVLVASLGWTSATTDDMIAAGMLTEDAEKAILVRNAKHIGMAATMYSDDHDGPLPSGEEFAQQLEPYLRGLKTSPTNSNPFNRPGTDQMAFQYFPLGDLNSVTDTAGTMMGMFDVGYSWQVILYADGHTAVVPKK